MSRVLVVVGLSACLFAGCGGGGGGPDSDLAQAGPALRAALEAWKGGKTPQELEAQSPSIVMNEGEWHDGKRLLDYAMEESGAMEGRQVRWRVRLKLRGKDGAAVDRRVGYIIDTTPRVVIVRELMAP